MTTAPGARASAESITAIIAGRVRELRDKIGLKQGELADRMSDLGVNWKRATVVALEARSAESRAKGVGRDAVTVQELLALAVVLGVPPVWLLVDPEGGATTSVSPGKDRDPWSTIWWLTARQPLDDHPGMLWPGAATPIDEAANIIELLKVYDRWLADTEFLENAIDVSDSRASREGQILKRLVPSMEKLAEWGYVQPPIPPNVRQRAAELGIDLPGAED